MKKFFSSVHPLLYAGVATIIVIVISWIAIPDNRSAPGGIWTILGLATVGVLGVTSLALGIIKTWKELKGSLMSGKENEIQVFVHVFRPPNITDHVPGVQIRVDVPGMGSPSTDIDGIAKFSFPVSLMGSEVTIGAWFNDYKVEKKVDIKDKTRVDIPWDIPPAREAKPEGTKTSPPPPDMDALKTAYLNYVFETSGRLSLLTIDRQETDETAAQINLDSIYTALLTLTSEEQTKARSEIFSSKDIEAKRLSAITMLDKYNRLVLLGEPGSGKSTLVSFVAMCMAGQILGRMEANIEKMTAPLPGDEDRKNEHENEPQKQPWTWGPLLPVRIILRDFAVHLPKPGKPVSVDMLWDFLRKDLKPKQLDAYVDEIINTFHSIRGGILLVDGLDEVFEAEHRRTQIKKIMEDFSAAYPHCRVVVTSRTYAYQEQDWKLSRFHEAVLAPFTKPQIHHFVERWYEYFSAIKKVDPQNAPGNAALLIRAIDQEENLYQLAQRPLLLTLMASLHAWRNGKLPDRRWELYEETVDLLLNRWEGRRVNKDEKGEVIDIIPSLTEWLKVGDRKEIRSLLDRLAFDAHGRQASLVGTADIPEDELLLGLMKLHNNQEANQQKIKEFLINRAGLLVPRGVGVYTFPHRTIQEYLAACHLTRFGYPHPVAKLACQDPLRWREVALLAGAKAGFGAEFSIWALADSLCPETNDPGCSEEKQWGAIIAGSLLVESANYLQTAEGDQPKLIRIKDRLKYVIEKSAQSSLERARSGVTLARLGDPRLEVTDLDSMRFCFIPAGEFWYGEGKDIKNIPLSAFWLAEFPVSNAQFKAFVEEDGYTNGDWWDEAKKEKYWTRQGFKGRYDDARRRAPVKFRDPFGLANHPVVGVTWYEADAYTRWLAARWRKKGWLPQGWHVTLPREQQWVKAARGGLSVPPQEQAIPLVISAIQPNITPSYDLADNPAVEREYPWRGKFFPNRANTAESGLGATSALGCFPAGASPYGLLDLSGNVWEWQQENNLRGGSWGNNSGDARCAYRGGGSPRDRDRSIGFRCALSSGS